MSTQAESIAGMTKTELREFIRRTVQEMVWEAEQQHDPDEGLEFTPEIVERLSTYIEERPRGKAIDDVERSLGLEE